MKMEHLSLIKVFVGMFILVGLFSFASATITVTLPMSEPTSLTAILQSGGSLDASTTYYYTIIAYDTKSYTPVSASIFNYHSPLSVEGSFTTNGTHQSVTISWTNSAEHNSNTRYQILLTKISGNYTASGGYNTVAENIGDTFTTGESGGYTITTENNGSYAIHSANLVNNLSFGINKSLGIIKVNVSSGGYGYSSPYGYKYGLQAIYEEIVSAGYEDYVYWDGYHFAVKGWIIMDGTATTYINLRNVDITFIKGGLHINNPNGYFQCGYWANDNYGADYNTGCNIHLLNSRFPMRALGNGQFKIYGSRIMPSNYEGLLGFETEILSNAGYIGGSNYNLIYSIDEVKDNIIGGHIRSIASVVKDIKIGIGNNWHFTDTYRMRVTSNRPSCYSTNCRIYDTTWLTTLLTSSGMRQYVPASGTNFSTFLYDPVFLVYYYSNNNLPPVWYYATNYGTLISGTYTQVQNSLIIKVIDENGIPLENVIVDVKDVNGDEVTWIEHDATTDRTVTGNEYNTARLTNENGTIDYYVVAYNITLNQSNNIADSYNDNYNKTDFYPFTITVSKDGYSTQEIYLDTFTKKTNMIIPLADRTWNYSENLKVMFLNDSDVGIMKLQSVTGNLAIAGNLYENTNSSFINSLTNVKFRMPNIFALTNNGDLYILGKLMEMIT